jgi:hypothetical protein
MRDRLTVPFDIHYVEGSEGNRCATTQARAIFALLNWLRTATTAIPTPTQPQ